MNKLTNVLKNMESETVGVKNDVINFLLEDVENYSPQDKLQDLLLNGCGSGMVNHLIYYTDTVEYFEEHESEIMEMLEMHGITDVESWDGIQELSYLFPQLDSADDRYDEADMEILEKAENETPNAYGDEWDDMDDDEQMDAIQEYASSICMYENDPMELNTQDKNYLAWVIFEYEAVNLENELSEMGVL